MDDDEYKEHVKAEAARRKRESRVRQGGLALVQREEGKGNVAQSISSELEEHTRDAVVIAKVLALLEPCSDMFEEFHRLAKLETVVDPRYGDLDTLELQAAYIKLLKRGVGTKEYAAGRVIEEHTFNNQGGCVLGLLREVLTDSQVTRAAFDALLCQQRHVISQVHARNDDPELALKEDELMLEFLHRSNAPWTTKMQMRKMRGLNNEVTIESEIQRWLAQHKSNGRGGMQVHAGANHKRRERAEQALNWAYTGLCADDIPRFSSADTSARNDRAIHAHMRAWLRNLLDGELPFIAWDEGSKRGYTACIAYLTATLSGEALLEWKKQWALIETTVCAPRKAGKGKGVKGKGVEDVGDAVDDDSDAREKVRALLGLRYTKDKTGEAISGCIHSMLEDLMVKYVYFALVDGAATNLGKHRGSVQRLRSKLNSPFVSSIRCLCHIIACGQKTMMLKTFGASSRASIGRKSTETATLDRGSALLEDVAAVVRGLPGCEEHLQELELYNQQAPFGGGMVFLDLWMGLWL
jgi:hypothetical protein